MYFDWRKKGIGQRELSEKDKDLPEQREREREKEHQEHVRKTTYKTSYLIQLQHLGIFSISPLLIHHTTTVPLLPLVLFKNSFSIILLISL